MLLRRAAWLCSILPAGGMVAWLACYRIQVQLTMFFRSEL
jgi:hypothetical protein